LKSSKAFQDGAAIKCGFRQLELETSVSIFAKVSVFIRRPLKGGVIPLLFLNLLANFLQKYRNFTELILQFEKFIIST